MKKLGFLFLMVLAFFFLVPDPAGACNGVAAQPVVAFAAPTFAFAAPAIPTAAVPVGFGFQSGFNFQSSAGFAAVPVGGFAFAATPVFAAVNPVIVQQRVVFARRGGAVFLNRGADVSVFQRRGLFGDLTITRVRR